MKSNSLTARFWSTWEAYYYNYNIVENQIADENGEEKPLRLRSSESVGTPTKKIIKAVISVGYYARNLFQR